MATLKYLSQYFTTALNVGGGIDDSQTTGIILLDVSGVTDITKPGQICITYSDPIDTSVAEWIDYTSINGSNELVGAVRGREGYSAHAHLQSATVAFVFSASHHNDIVDQLNGTETGTTLTSPVINTGFSGTAKASPTSAATGTSETEIMTPYSSAIYANSSLSRQAIINGNFDVWQRGTTATITATAFLADRWQEVMALDGGTAPTLTRSRQLLTSGDIANAFYHTRLASNGAGTSIGNSSYHRYSQKIENGTRNLAGNGKKVTVSFYARSDIANKRIGLVIYQRYGSGGSPSATETLKSGPISLTTSWAKYTYTFTTNTLVGKTFGTAYDDSLDFNIYDQWGTTIGNSEVETGITAEPYASGYIDYAQVQLCAGDVALPFQPKSFEEELRACQRYCQARSVSGYEGLGQGNAGSTTVAYIQIPFYAEMRTSPALTATAGDWRLFDSAGSGFDLTAITLDAGTKSKYIAAITATVASGLTQWRPYLFGGDNGGTRVMIFDAEL